MIVVVKNTGHDYIGRSAGRGGFALWTHQMKSISRDQAFVPHGCQAPAWAPQDSVRVGAGAQWLDVARWAQAQNVTVVSGDTPQVGAAGGWLLVSEGYFVSDTASEFFPNSLGTEQGGGHSFLSPYYGLGVDNLLEMDIVMPDGTLQTVSECSNSDLFWAVSVVLFEYPSLSFIVLLQVRGGGGATFGVVTSVVYKAHPPTPVSAIVAYQNNSFSPEQVLLVTSALAEIAPTVGDLGLGGIFSASVGQGALLILILPNRTLSQLMNGQHLPRSGKIYSE